MKIYIHKLLLLFFLLFGLTLGSSTHLCDTFLLFACDIEDDDDWWQFNEGDDDSWTDLPEITCTPDNPPDPPAQDDDPDLDWFIKDEYDDEDDDWGDDPCEMGDCDDLYDDITANKTNEDEIKKDKEEKEEECTPQKDINGAIKRINGKDECVTDCMGVKGGKAYTKECHGETICIDGNNGVFTNTLTGEALDKFEQIEQEMQQNCLQAALLNNLNENYGIQISYSTAQSTPGSFNPCNYRIVFNSLNGINSYSVTAELFHAYQEQYLGGLLSDIQNSLDHKGGSNIEAGEKAMGYLASLYSFMNVNVDSTLLYNWCEHFFDSHQGHHTDVTLTQNEIDDWFAAVEEFKQYNRNSKTSSDNDLYDAPIDYDLLPNSLLDLWNNIDPNCVRTEIIVGKKIIFGNTQIGKIKW